MSRENVEIVRERYADPAPLSSGSHFAPDAEFDFTAIYPDQPVLRGVDEMHRFRDAGPWGRSIHFEPERYFDVDDERVLVFVRVTSTGQASGAAVESRVAQEFTIRDGLIVRIKVHRDRSEALEAVGLSQPAPSRENVEIVKRAVDAYNRRDLDEFDELLSSDFEWFPALVRGVEGGSYRGREGIETYYRDIRDTWEEYYTVPHEFRDLGDRVLVLGRMEGRGKESGATVGAPFGLVFDFRDGKISRLRSYLDQAEASRAAGRAQ